VGRGSTKARLKSGEEKARKAGELQTELDDLGINIELSNGSFPDKLRGNGMSFDKYFYQINQIFYFTFT
jgi:hypothetical protein